ncbi:MAG: hypothetical protein CL869_01770 [Cytophagia bacterium]|nr:hypothetical protein [Cytophagia bacterium]|tara:strand:+ start:1332 stop:3125 length:1794 start_codon:yes stop_codon:yes gene_type:complete
MNGFTYIESWNPTLIPLISFILGSFSYLSLSGIGRNINNLFDLKIEKPWNITFRTIVGLFIFSLINQIIAILKINNFYIYLLVTIIFLFFGLSEFLFLFKERHIKLKFHKKNLIPISILISIYLIRILLSIIPTTKIDELNYHMLLPLRIVSDKALIYYQFPWEGSIWPHMHYQIIGSPFYSLGIPDSLNILSLCIFISFLLTVYNLVFIDTKNSYLGLWCIILISSGLNVSVDIITNSSNSLLITSSTLALILISKPKRYLINTDLRTFSVFYGFLILSIVGSKISMVPISFVLFLFFIKIIHNLWSSEKITTGIIYFFIPLIIFYTPLLIYSWLMSGSPFGTFLNSFFTCEKVLFDPFLEFSRGNLGYRGNIKEILFLMFSRWSPIIWFSWLIIPSKRIELHQKIVLLTIFIVQFFIICFFLPNKPRHFSGFQYAALIVIFIEILPYLYLKAKKVIFSIFLVFSIPWLILDIYYAFPLIKKAFLDTETFKQDYIFFYNDYKKLDKLIDEDAQLLIKGTRINSFHSPRKVFRNIIDIKDKSLPTYLFLVGDYDSNKIRGIKVKEKIYENKISKQYCFRDPRKQCTLKKLRVFRINF